MTKPIFALLTDFGFDFAVASLKGVILGSFPDAHIVDLDHTIDKFNRISAAFVLKKTYRFFPRGTTFICIIDPGVGSRRKALCIELDGYTFIAPDNGILHHFIKKNAKIWLIDDTIIIPHSNTFHGRDLFVPAAIALACNQRDFLKPLEKHLCVRLHELNAKQLIVYCDSFGNLKTNIEADTIKSDCITLTIRSSTYIIPQKTTFDDVLPGELFCYRGSNDTIEFAINQGSAQAYLGVACGEEIVVS